MDWSSFWLGILTLVGIQAVLNGLLFWGATRAAKRQAAQEREAALERTLVKVGIEHATGRQLYVVKPSELVDSQLVSLS